MSLTTILILAGVAGLLGFLRHLRWRTYLLLAASVVAVYALQPTLPIRGLDFYLPTLTLMLVYLAWVITTPKDKRDWKGNLPGVFIIGGVVLALALTRVFGLPHVLTASRPPATLNIVIMLVLTGVLGAAVMLFSKTGKAILTTAFMVVLTLFIVLKVPAISLQVSLWLRGLNAQALSTATTLDIRWLGYSYIAFRLLHTIRDRQTGRLPEVTLAEYTVYAVFFPTLAAGPIDRIERFSKDLRKAPERGAEDWGEAGKRILVGMFKKFVVADGLGLFALSAVNALQVNKAGWALIMLYAYAFQLYYDFSGYTDIAIGMGRLMGFKLPENFNAPYRKPNLTQFWNNWHMTLTQWFRGYFFNPMTRAMRSTIKPIALPIIIVTTQVATMVLIGLWHGVSVNFVVWGILQGAGLFIHNRWSERTKAGFAKLPERKQKWLNAGGALLTFHFMAFSFILFALPTPEVSLQFLKTLLGVA